MSGLSNNKKGTFKYVKIKDGNFYLTTDKNHETPYTELGGTIVALGFRDEEWEGKEVRKLQITIKDEEDQLYVLSFPVDSSYTGNFVAFAKNADLSQPLTIQVSAKEYTDEKGNIKTRRSLFMSQDGKFLKKFYTKDNRNGLPDFKQVKISGKIMFDKTDYLAFLENVIENELKPTLPSQEDVLTVKKEVFPSISEGIDDLPF